MEPSSVFRTIWRQRWFAIPALVVALAAAFFVFAYGPRDYEATVSYALVDPRVPTDAQIEQDPSLKLLNSDNPYLRSTDPNLIANVLITRLNSPARQEAMKSMGLSGDYLASPGVGGAGLIVSIAATGSTPRQTLATTKELGRVLVSNLRAVQKINGADDRFLYTALIVDEPDRAIEKLSSRLRAVIIAGIAGIILIFGAVSLGNAIETGRRRRRTEHTGTEASDTGPSDDTAHPDQTVHADEDAHADEGARAAAVSAPSIPRAGSGRTSTGSSRKRRRTAARAAERTSGASLAAPPASGEEVHAASDPR